MSHSARRRPLPTISSTEPDYGDSPLVLLLFAAVTLPSMVVGVFSTAVLGAALGLLEPTSGFPFLGLIPGTVAGLVLARAALKMYWRRTKVVSTRSKGILEVAASEFRALEDLTGRLIDREQAATTLEASERLLRAMVEHARELRADPHLAQEALWEGERLLRSQLNELELSVTEVRALLEDEAALGIRTDSVRTTASSLTDAGDVLRAQRERNVERRRVTEDARRELERTLAELPDPMEEVRSSVARGRWATNG